MQSLNINCIKHTNVDDGARKHRLTGIELYTIHELGGYSEDHFTVIATKQIATKQIPSTVWACLSKVVLRKNGCVSLTISLEDILAVVFPLSKVGKVAINGIEHECSPMVLLLFICFTAWLSFCYFALFIDDFNCRFYVPLSRIKTVFV